MNLANKLKYLSIGTLLIFSVGLVQAQSTRTEASGTLKSITSRIHVPGSQSIPADGLRGLVKNLNSQNQVKVTAVNWWLVSSIDTAFVFFPGSKLAVGQTFYAYNTNGDITKDLFKVYNDTTSTFENSSLSQNGYDSNFNRTNSMTMLWNKKTSSFDNYLQTIYSFNSANLETEEYSQFWSGSSWDNSTRMTTKYDSQNRDTEEVSQNWIASAWMNNIRTAYSYGSGTQQTMELDQTWNGNQWVNSEQHVYTVSNNNIDTDVFQVWTNGQWADSTKDLYSYDSSIRPTQIVEQIMKGGNWVDTTRTTITYHSSSGYDLASDVNQAWDGSQWVNVNQIVYTYDSNNHITESLYQDWGGSNWVGTARILSTFDSNGNNVHTLTQYFMTSWENFSSLTNTYSQSRPTDIPTPIDKPVADVPSNYELLQNYPNPFNPSTIIQYKLAKTGMVRLTVYDLTGRQVARLVNQTQGAGSYFVRFNADQLASGIYFYRLQTDEFSQIRKMLLIR